MDESFDIWMAAEAVNTIDELRTMTAFMMNVTWLAAACYGRIIQIS